MHKPHHRMAGAEIVEIRYQDERPTKKILIDSI
jgi:hypothetical protein